MKRSVLFLLAALMLPMAEQRAVGQVSQASEAVAESLINVMLREGGQAAASELTEFGGKAAIHALLQRAARESGDSLADRVVQYGSCYGPPALKAIEPSPSRMIRALDRLPSDLIQQAISAAARDPKLLSSLISAYGDEVLEVVARQPGVGAGLVEKLGLDGIRIGNRLTTDQAVVLARHADDIAALPSSERSHLVDAMIKAPAQVLDYLETHPKVLLTAGGVSAIIATNENLPGGAVPSSSHEASRAGLIERVIFRLEDKFSGPVTAVVLILVLGFGAYVLIRLRNVWKLGAMRIERERSRAAATRLRRPVAIRRAPLR